jgi:hypothetical protein
MEARAEFSKAISEDLHDWVKLMAELKGKGQGYLFDTRGLMPVDRLKIVLPGTNVAMPLKVYSRGKETDSWQFRTEALVHRLKIEGEVHSGEEIRLTSIVTDRLWKVEPKMAQEVSNLPPTVELHVGWVPKRLVFLAQGKGPYTLAFGSSSRLAPPFPLQSLLDRVTPEARNKLLVGSAHRGGMQSLGGEHALGPLQPPVSWKQWVLWSILVAGVALMGWMAFKLHRQLGKGDA